MSSIVPAVASAVVGSALAPKPKSPSVSKAQTTVNPADYIAPNYEQIVSEAQKLYESGQLGAFQELSPLQLSAISQGLGMAQQMPLFGQSQEAVSQLLGGAGSFLSPAQDIYMGLAGMPDTTSTQAFQDTLDTLISPAIQKTTSQFAGSGRLGSGLFGSSLGAGITSAAAPAILQAQQADYERKLAAAKGLGQLGQLGIGALGAGLGAAPAIAGLGYQNIENQLALAGLLSQQDFLKQQQDVNALNEYLKLIQGATVSGTGTTTKPVYKTPSYGMGDVLGGALSGTLLDYGTGAIGDFLGGLGGSSGGGSGSGGLDLGGYELGGAAEGIFGFGG